jgi:polyferredoxin
MILTVYMGTWIWHYLLPYITLSQEVFSLVIFSSFTAGVYYLVAVILLDFAVMPGEFCRSVCPTGFFLKVIGKFRPIRLKVDNSQCPKYCVSCQNSCELKLYPKEDAKLNDCHLCLKCVDACPKSILKVGVVNFRNL